MNNKFLFLTILTVIAVAVTACGDVAPATEAPATNAPVLTEPPTLERIPPTEPKLPGEKQSLGLKSTPPFSVLTVIGFIFSDGQVAIKAAPKESISTEPDGPDGLTMVGIVEIGSGASDIEPGLYSVAIDLASQENEVNGLLILVNDSLKTYPQHFSRVLQQVNPQRNPSTLPDPGVSILSSSVCFVVGLGDDPKSYFRYCSVFEPFLSVSNEFSENYESLKIQVAESATKLEFQGDLALDLSVSELEDSSNTENCISNAENCSADISGAPVSSFSADYDNAKNNAAGEKFAVTAGIIRVQRELNIDEIFIKPGDYRVEYWFNPDGTFIGATLLGRTAEGEDVVDQQIPAGEPAFINVEGPQLNTSEISAWKLCGKCLIRQSSCP